MQRILSTFIIFVSAFLLFQVQPILSKQLLPEFGGGASVWSSSLFFYQGMLLLGYLYAHLLSRYQLKNQLLTHTVLVLLSSIITFSHLDVTTFLLLCPTTLVFAKLFVQVGLAFILLSATSVLLQRWYIESTHSTVPYHWYSLSNLGSLLALMSYPFIFEVTLSINEQKHYWIVGLITYCTLLLCLLYVLFRNGTLIQQTATAQKNRLFVKPNVLWIAFSATSSIMLIATTQMISTNIPPMPLVWTLPLAIYLLTFSYTFASVKNYNRTHWAYLLILSVFAGLIMFFLGSQFNALAQLLIYGFILFIVCMICHGELRKLAPDGSQLTVFYLYIALGGVIGSLFSALLAPVLFTQITEYIVALAAILTLFIYLQFAETENLSVLYKATLLSTLLVWGASYSYLFINFNQYNLASERNFYGYVTVKDITTPDLAERRLIDGTTIHGSQPLDQHTELKNSYYHQHTGIAKSLSALKKQENLNIGIVGLGAGVLAKFGDKHDRIRFYELNPAVYTMATSYFSYLQDSPAQIEVAIGDGRITLTEEVKNKAPLMNALIIDAFSSDVIPTHLLTEEAFSLYWQRLTRNGLLILHISNNHIDLMPVLQIHSKRFNKSLLKFKYTDTQLGSEWVVLTSNQAFLNSIAITDLSPVTPYLKTRITQWTDQKHSLLPLLKL
ncbi:fused MFS/spermidine synthase [Pseudoalteromonas haloplanktis]|uniref:Fused MFS/spermidine synthase n=1 Tax=Pseudoalteromonas haloplanktis TaxID=228 RepID=A0ABU1BCT2_PSEHA|nr:fused MFS/spermidine synthase [Pseudoalteromonas haloplanktis]MDQ9091334.1 fused MFS/spermidine synthase [Pseudoalteromonas haloplanktis]